MFEELARGRAARTLDAMQRRAGLLLVTAFAACALALVARSGPGTAGTAVAAASPCGSVSKPPAYTHIVVIAFENHSYQSVLGSSEPASYFKTIAAQCGSATAFRAASFPHSLPNYLAGNRGNPRIDQRRVPARGNLPPEDVEHLSAARLDPVVGVERVDADPVRPRERLTVRGAPQPGGVLQRAFHRRLSRRRRCDAFNVVDHPGVHLDHPEPERRSHQRHTGDRRRMAPEAAHRSARPPGERALHEREHGHLRMVRQRCQTDSATTPIPLIVISPSTHAGTVSTSLTDCSLLRTWEDLLGLPCLASACSANGAETYPVQPLIATASRTTRRTDRPYAGPSPSAGSR